MVLDYPKNPHQHNKEHSDTPSSPADKGKVPLETQITPPHRASTSSIEEIGTSSSQKDTLPFAHSPATRKNAVNIEPDTPLILDLAAKLTMVPIGARIGVNMPASCDSFGDSFGDSFEETQSKESTKDAPTLDFMTNLPQVSRLACGVAPFGTSTPPRMILINCNQTDRSALTIQPTDPSPSPLAEWDPEHDSGDEPNNFPPISSTYVSSAWSDEVVVPLIPSNQKSNKETHRITML